MHFNEDGFSVDLLSSEGKLEEVDKIERRVAFRDRKGRSIPRFPNRKTDNLARLVKCGLSSKKHKPVTL